MSGYCDFAPGHPQKVIDFGWRGKHLQAVRSKDIIRAHYGQPAKHSYFRSCSNGGRQALMEIQRFPDDYDLMSVGAPVYTLQTQTSAVLRNQTFAKNAGGFTAADLQLAQTAALNACDADDGLKDGLINDPRTCRWDPATIQCTGAKTASCLTAPQVTALRTVYEGIRAPDGEWAMLPMSRGGEAGWAAFVGTGGAGPDPTNGLLPVRPVAERPAG